MLIKCTECELQISDKALSCPHCGYPRMGLEKKRRKSSNKKHKRLPNGFGQITELKNDRLRCKYRAMVTVGKTKEGKPICKLLKPISYFKTYNDAYSALVEFNKNPYDVAEVSMTMQMLYDRWSDDYFEKLESKNSFRNIKSAWSYCSSIQNMILRDVRIRHLKGCIENAEKDGTPASDKTKQRIKSMFNLMFDYAMEYELVEMNYAREFSSKTPTTVQKEHIDYTDEEMEILWEHEDDPYVQCILIQCYSGWRPQELIKLKVENIKDGVMTGGMKTAAGKDRDVPIHSRIQHLIDGKIKEAVELGSEYLVNDTDKKKPFTYDTLRRRFEKLRSELDINPEHRPHDGRVHFITQAKLHGVDEYVIKRIAGHTIVDITEKVYTKRSIEWLKSEIEKIT